MARASRGNRKGAADHAASYDQAKGSEMWLGKHRTEWQEIVRASMYLLDIIRMER